MAGSKAYITALCIKTSVYVELFLGGVLFYLEYSIDIDIQ